MPATPTPSQERWLAVAARLESQRGAAAVVQGSGGWRSVGLVGRCALFALGIVVALTASGMVALTLVAPFARNSGSGSGPSLAWLIDGLLLCAAGEWLMSQWKRWHAGLEEALWLGGALLVCGWLALQLDSHDERLAIAAGLCACAAAGWRLRNALFTTLAALALGALIQVVLERAHIAGARLPPLAAALCCGAIALVALLAGTRRFQRPSSDAMLDWLVVLLPIAGYVWAALSAWVGVRPTMGALWWPLVIALSGYGLLALWIGLQRRQHAPLLAAMLCMAGVAFELRHLTSLPQSVRLVLWGAMLGVAALALERWLRTPRSGITARPLDEGDSVADLLPTAGAAVLGPQARSDPAPGFSGRGGSFGGGGASGQF